jgi:hypothetical protein
MMSRIGIGDTETKYHDVSKRIAELQESILKLKAEQIDLYNIMLGHKSLHHLPTSIISHIMTYITALDIVICRAVCKVLNQCSRLSSSWRYVTYGTLASYELVRSMRRYQLLNRVCEEIVAYHPCVEYLNAIEWDIQENKVINTMLCAGSTSLRELHLVWPYIGNRSPVRSDELTEMVRCMPRLTKLHIQQSDPDGISEQHIDRICGINTLESLRLANNTVEIGERIRKNIISGNMRNLTELYLQDIRQSTFDCLIQIQQLKGIGVHRVAENRIDLSGLMNAAHLQSISLTLFHYNGTKWLNEYNKQIEILRSLKPGVLNKLTYQILLPDWPTAPWKELFISIASIPVRELHVLAPFPAPFPSNDSVEYESCIDSDMASIASNRHIQSLHLYRACRGINSMTVDEALQCIALLPAIQTLHCHLDSESMLKVNARIKTYFAETRYALDLSPCQVHTRRW